MAVAFSSNDSDVIKRKIHVDHLSNETLSGDQLDYFYDLPKCIEWIKSNDFKKVTLQFPDNLLKDSVLVQSNLEENTASKIFIVGGNKYESCCVDKISPKHVEADATIHFGHSCLSPTKCLPTLYIFGKATFDVDSASKEFHRLFPDAESNVVILYDVFYSYAMGELEECLKSDYRNLVFSQLKFPSNESHGSGASKDKTLQKVVCGRSFEIPKSQLLSNYIMFFIGSENRTLSNFMISFNNCKFCSYDPTKRIGRQESFSVNKYLRKRYHYIEKAKDAKLIGILIDAESASEKRAIKDHMRLLIKGAGKKSYTLITSRFTSVYLANFPAIDIFVYVACPETSIVDSHEFYQSIVTPFELEVAFNQAREWTSDCITDFNELLPGGSSYIPLNPVKEVTCDVSLITGKLRSLGAQSEDSAESSAGSDLVVRNEMKISNIHLNAAGEDLAGRSWHGLEQCLGETPVRKVTQGGSGIASGYEGEGERS